MFRSIRLVTFLGIPVTAHWSLLLLTAWAVSIGYLHQGPEMALSYASVIAGSIVSVLAHEYGHILVARRYGIRTLSINLSPIGGIAFLERYPETPGQRALVALGGPAVSLVLAVAFGTWAALAYGEEGLATAVGMLFLVNGMILLFNLLPIYPMDGGQVLNAAAHKVGGKRFARGVSMWTGMAGTASMAVIGAVLPSISIAVIGVFLFAVVSMEFETPLARMFGYKKPKDAASPAHAEAPQHNGIFVAFDGAGRHFAYARHWLDCPEDMDGQKMAIAVYEIEARALGGELRLLSPDEYREQVLECPAA